MFQFHANWKIEKNPPPSEAGEVRVIFRNPTKPIRVMAMVSDIGKTITRGQFESSPNRDAVLEVMMEWTVEQIYKKTSWDIGAERMFVSEKQVQPSDAGIRFYISEAHVKGKVSIVTTGIHIVTFEKPHIVTFPMTTHADPTATKDNETITRVFNSFYVLGERPIK